MESDQTKMKGPSILELNDNQKSGRVLQNSLVNLSALILIFGIALWVAGYSPVRAASDPAPMDPNRESLIFPEAFQAPKTGKAASSAQSAPREAVQDYRVGPGDQFIINFWGSTEDSVILTIDVENRLFIPRIGVIQTKGLSYAELVSKIGSKVRNSIRNVNFTISLHRPREFQVYVLGAVKNPGPITAAATSRVSDAIAKAEGILPTGSRQFIEVRQAYSNGKSRKVRANLTRFFATGNFQANPYLTEDDVVFVPNLAAFVTVSGAVTSPGVFEILESKKITDALDAVGGLSAYAAPTARIKLTRMESNGKRAVYFIILKEEYRIHSSDLIAENVELRHGDEIFVSSQPLLIPPDKNVVYVSGAVRLPGPQSFQNALSIRGYVGLAGGVTDRADFPGITIYRLDGSKMPASERTPLEPGDTIYVPEKTFKFWQDHLTILTTFLTLATTVIAITR